MTINISRKQVTDLARSIDIPGKSYNQKLDIVAKSFGFENQATLMAVLNQDVSGPEDDLLSGTIADWESEGNIYPGDDPIQDPAPFVVRRDGPSSVDVHVGGSQEDYTKSGASSVRIERRGDRTRFMLYDACCDSPRVFEVPDHGPMVEAPNDWESVPRDVSQREAPEAM